MRLTTPYEEQVPPLVKTIEVDADHGKVRFEIPDHNHLLFGQLVDDIRYAQQHPEKFPANFTCHHTNGNVQVTIESKNLAQLTRCALNFMRIERQKPMGTGVETYASTSAIQSMLGRLRTYAEDTGATHHTTAIQSLINSFNQQTAGRG